MPVFGLFRRRRFERTGYTLYTAAVGAARDPFYYRELGIADTLDGRFDMVGLHAFLLIDRLHKAAAPGPAVAQAVFDAMFSDMDHTLREMGVGDMTVGRRVKAMWEALHGRSLAYAPALEAGDDAALAAALARNVWRGSAPEGAAEVLAGIVRRQWAALAAQPLSELAAGRVVFAPPLVAEAA